MIRDLALFAVVASIGIFGFFLIAGHFQTVEAAQEAKKVVVRDVLGKRIHNLSGMVMVPTNCHDLLTRTEEIDLENYLIAFNTWQDPTRVCNSEPVPRQFHLTLFAPSVGIAFQATLDDTPIPLEVIPAVE